MRIVDGPLMLDFQFGKPGGQLTRQRCCRSVHGLWLKLVTRRLLRIAGVPLLACDGRSICMLDSWLRFSAFGSGCDGTSADFVSYASANMGLLAASIAPTIVIMPLLIVYLLQLHSAALPEVHR